MIQKTRKYLIFLILLLATFLRFWRLGDDPALNADEAAIGYNAYSLIQTGHDEHGNSWPIHFQSFNDYKPGLYFYLVLPFVKLLGLNEWAVRIPGAFLGVATVYLIYLLVKELFKNHESPVTNHQSLPIIAAFFLAISPWHIHFSRGGWEVNVATFFIVLGLLLFLKGLNSLPVLMVSFVSFALSFYTYHAARIIVPLLILGLLVIYWKEVKTNFKNIVLTGLVGLVAVLPLIKDLTRTDIYSRAVGVGLFADIGPLARINEQRGEHSDYMSLPAKILHNKAVNYGLAFMENWSAHYHGLFLFLSGDDIQRNKVPETGQMYLFDFLFVAIGLFYIFKNYSRYTKPYSLILWWLIIAPSAAALTFQSPHALRSQNMVIPLTIISASGMYKIVEWLYTAKQANSQRFGFLVLGVLIVWSFSRYLHMYWVHMAKEYPYSSQYGVKELVSFIKQKQSGYKKVIVTDRYDQPYVLFLFYLKYPPEKFQKDHILTERDGFGFSTVRAFDKYEFRSINWDVDKPRNPNSLIIGTNEEVPDEANIIGEIYGTNGYKYFDVVAN